MAVSEARIAACVAACEGIRTARLKSANWYVLMVSTDHASIDPSTGLLKVYAEMKLDGS